MASPAPVPFPSPKMTEQEYLTSEFEINPEFVDDHIEERNVGEIEHSNWRRALLLWFAANTNLLAAPEVHIRVAPGRFRIPDVAVFLEPPHGVYVTKAPLAVIEILSLSDSYLRLKERMQDYARMGVPNLFVIESRTVITQYQEGRFVPAAERSPLEGSGSHIDWKMAAGYLWPNDLA